MKFLIPVDGSEQANAAVEYVLKLSEALNEPPHICLLNVQWKIASGNVKLLINTDTINDYYRELGMAALAKAKSKLDAANLAYEYHISIGVPAEAIVQYANQHGVEQIVMSYHGEGSLQALLLGSVVSKVLHLSSCPVLVVK
jgi:nucleotide-binding universal stress UspA family protein